jgi:hypothetical protein
MPAARVPGNTINRRLPTLRTVGYDQADPIAVERIITGRRPPIVARAELWLAMDHLDKYGLSASQVALRVGCCPRTVQRRRTRRRRNQGES